MIHIAQGSVIDDELHGKQYRIRRRLGAGGFGTAYLAVELNKQGGERRHSETCLKFSTYGDEWHGEVYFLSLLKDAGHVVQMRSAFTTRVMVGGKARLLFCIEMEYVAAGSVNDMCNAGFDAWTEEQVRHRVRQLLKPLALLHEMQVSHRDVTPGNVFVGSRKVLKLGDFGITKPRLTQAGVRANTLAEYYAPNDLGAWWRPRDDVYQVGLLMCTLLTGRQIGGGIGLTKVNTFTERGPLREAIKAALRGRNKRVATAGDLGAMLERA